MRDGIAAAIRTAEFIRRKTHHANAERVVRR